MRRSRCSTGGCAASFASTTATTVYRRSTKQLVSDERVLLCRRVRLVDRAGSRILHAVGALQVVGQALSELALLIPQELARGRLVDRREMLSEVPQPLTG